MGWIENRAWRILIRRSTPRIRLRHDQHVRNWIASSVSTRPYFSGPVVGSQEFK